MTVIHCPLGELGVGHHDGLLAVLGSTHAIGEHTLCLGVKAVEVDHPVVQPLAFDTGQRAIHHHAHSCGGRRDLGHQRVFLDAIQRRQLVGQLDEGHQVHRTTVAHSTHQRSGDSLVVHAITCLEDIRGGFQ